MREQPNGREERTHGTDETRTRQRDSNRPESVGSMMALASWKRKACLLGVMNVGRGHLRCNHISVQFTSPLIRVLGLEY